MKTKEAKRIIELARKAVEIKAQLDAVKPLYDEMDRITLEMASLSPDPVAVDGSTVCLVDNFSVKNVCFKMAAVRRFELKIEKKAA